MALKPRARNPRGVRVQELFVEPPERVRDWSRRLIALAGARAFNRLHHVLRAVEPLFPRGIRRRAIDWSARFVTKRLNGEDGLGAIYPAMANSVMMFDVLGYSPDHPDAAIAMASVKKLLVIEEDRAYCQPCLSPVWDTGLAGHAIAEADSPANPSVTAACDWLRPLQILDTVGDWAAARPDAPPGGWAFQYANPHYPDVDDTAVVGMLLHRQGDPGHAELIRRAREWIVAMQGKDGAGGRSTPTTTIITSTTSPSRIMGRCSTPRRPMSRLVVSRSLPRSAIPRIGPYRPGAGLAAVGADAGWVLVRAVGDELHLWHLVGALRAQCRRGVA